MILRWNYQLAKARNSNKVFICTAKELRGRMEVKAEEAADVIRDEEDYFSHRFVLLFFTRGESAGSGFFGL